MIIDPDKDGCTIWQGSKVQHLRGTPKECCEKIAKYVFKRDVNYLDIGLDTAGIGMYYKDYFLHYKIPFGEIKAGKII